LPPARSEGESPTAGSNNMTAACAKFAREFANPRTRVYLRTSARPNEHAFHRLEIQSRVVRVAITSSPTWGIVWRADLVSAGPVPTWSRVVCTEDRIEIRPLVMSDSASIPPLR